MAELNTNYNFCVNVKNGRLHNVKKAKINCYKLMDTESPKYYNDLETAYLQTDAILTPCKLCMKNDLSEWQKIKEKFSKR